MATDQTFISRRPKKNRNRTTATGNIMLNAPPDSSPNFITPKTSPAAIIAPRKVPVLYYLTRNGHIEHPHLIDVPLSSLDGLFLRGNPVPFVVFINEKKTTERFSPCGLIILPV
ncbi:putative protein SOSEKI [Helianthus annuus]|nr:putative protein SOSEKI [Helianthus annuus]